MAKTKVFVSFDYDHDERLKIYLIGQSRNEDSPFSLADWSIKEHIDDNWKAHARRRIRSVDVLCVLCGRHTDTATGVSAEVRIAQEEGVPYFLLAGYSEGGNVKPRAARDSDRLYRWTWPNLKNLIGGSR
ncbi:TIR domain-containing protein [Rhizobium leguminosarum]|uniref:TIR domain-containing protein n=1 Tax=Rhizobium leguminosarum TaxID=384 RepID=UPI001C90AD70|nr:TIR domain-containing protein [Rhizobium leguminosarum]MBY2937195.1 hypothetical protein [Rhizobium leguminosarum]